MTMMVNQELCVGCGICVGVCPNHAIYLVDGKAQIDAVLCTACQACARECPNGAVQVVEIVSPVPVDLPGKIDKVPARIVPEGGARVPVWGSAVLEFTSRVLPSLFDNLPGILDRLLPSTAQGRTKVREDVRGSRLYRQRRQRRG